MTTKKPVLSLKNYGAPFFVAEHEDGPYLLSSPNQELGDTTITGPSSSTNVYVVNTTGTKAQIKNLNVSYRRYVVSVNSTTLTDLAVNNLYIQKLDQDQYNGGSLSGLWTGTGAGAGGISVQAGVNARSWMSRVYMDGEQVPLNLSGGYLTSNCQFVDYNSSSSSRLPQHFRDMTLINLSDTGPDIKSPLAYLANITVRNCHRMIRLFEGTNAYAVNCRFDLKQGSHLVYLRDNTCFLRHYNCVWVLPDGTELDAPPTSYISVEDGKTAERDAAKINNVIKLSSYDISAADATFFANVFDQIEFQRSNDNFTTWTSTVIRAGDHSFAPPLSDGTWKVRARYTHSGVTGPWSQTMTFTRTAGVVDYAGVTFADTPGDTPAAFVPSLYLFSRASTIYAGIAESSYKTATPASTINNTTLQPTAGTTGEDATAISALAAQTYLITNSNIANYKTGALVQLSTETTIENFNFVGVDTTTNAGAGIAIGNANNKYPAGRTIIRRFYLDGGETLNGTETATNGVYAYDSLLTQGNAAKRVIMRDGLIQNWRQSGVYSGDDIWLINTTVKNCHHLIKCYAGASVTAVDCNFDLGAGGVLFVWLEDETASFNYWNCRFNGRTAPLIDKCGVGTLLPFAARSILATQITALTAHPLTGGAGNLIHPSLAKDYEAAEYQYSDDAGSTWETFAYTERGEPVAPVPTSADGSFLARARLISRI